MRQRLTLTWCGQAPAADPRQGALIVTSACLSLSSSLPLSSSLSLSPSLPSSSPPSPSFLLLLPFLPSFLPSPLSSFFPSLLLVLFLRLVQILLIWVPPAASVHCGVPFGVSLLRSDVAFCWLRPAAATVASQLVAASGRFARLHALPTSVPTSVSLPSLWPSLLIDTRESLRGPLPQPLFRCTGDPLGAA